MKHSKRILLISAVLAAVPFGASRAAQVTFDRPFAPASHGVVNESERPYREEICLNGRWDFQAVPVPAGFVRMAGNPPALTDPSPAAWDAVPIKIPSPWNVNAFQKYPGAIPNGADYRYYPSYPEVWDKVEMAWMRRKFVVPKEWAGRDIRLHFEAVAGECEVRVNGKFLKRNFNLNLPFDVPVAEVVRLGEENEVLVGVRRDTLFYHQGVGGYRAVPSNTFWGWECAGIWQDVSLVALPKSHIADAFVQSFVDQDQLVLETKLEGAAGCEVEWNVYRWLPPAANADLLTRPEQTGKMDTKPVLSSGPAVAADASGGTLKTQVPVKGALDLWWPENPNLYVALVDLKRDGKIVDRKYVRFGWRQYGFDGNKFTVNGRPTRLRCDAIHFMGVADMSRRHIFAYFQTLRDMHANLARATVQIRPRAFYEVADEVGMMVLGETGIWADYAIHQEETWKRFHEECIGMVARDRNHASIVGWSIENEFFASLQAQQVPADAQIRAARRWEPIIKEMQAMDPTRPWVSADGEGQTWPPDTFRPPVSIAHYGDLERYTWYHKNLGEKDMPWGITESTDQYWWMPDSYEATVGDRVYDTLAAKMEGVGWLIYDMLANIQNPLNGFMTSVYNVSWYGLKPLPVGQTDVSRAPKPEEGVWFGPYREGEFGVQPERLGPYSVQFNPGYDPALPLYDPWPSFHAQKAAYTPGGPAPYAKPVIEPRPPLVAVPVTAQDVALVEGAGGLLRPSLGYAGIQLAPAAAGSARFLIMDAASLSAAQIKAAAPQWRQTLDAGGTVYVTGVKPETLSELNQLLPAPLELNARTSVSVVPNRGNPILSGVPSAAGYFAAPHGGGQIIMNQGMDGDFVRQGKVWFHAPEVDWRQWGIHLPELQRTVSIFRGERETKPSGVALAEHPAGKGRVIVSTLSQQAGSQKHLDLLRLVFGRMGVAMQAPPSRESGILDANGTVLKALKLGPFPGKSYQEVWSNPYLDEKECRPASGGQTAGKTWGPIQHQGPALGFVLDADGSGGFSASYLSFWLFSPLANEIVQNPYGSKVTLNIGADDGYKLWVNGLPAGESPAGGSFAPEFELLQGWNHVLIKIANAGGPSGTILSLKSSNAMLLGQLKTAMDAPAKP